MLFSRDDTRLEKITKFFLMNINFSCYLNKSWIFGNEGSFYSFVFRKVRILVRMVGYLLSLRNFKLLWHIQAKHATIGKIEKGLEISICLSAALFLNNL